MSYVTTGAWNYIKIPQFVEETTFGTCPSAPTFTSCGAITDNAYTAESGVITNRQLGSRDIYQDIKTAEIHQLVFKYQPYNTQFMRYGTELFNLTATDNISRSLSILWSQLINGVENYFLAQGCRTDKLEINVTEPKVEVTQTILAQKVNTPATSFALAGGTGTPVYCAPNVGAPWSGLNGGSAPLTINALSYDTISFKVTVNNNIDKVKPLGETFYKFLDPTNRDVIVDFDIVYKDTVSFGDMKTLTARSASMSINSGTTTSVGLTNLYLEKYASPDTPTANKIKTATYAGRAQQIAMVN